MSGSNTAGSTFYGALLLWHLQTTKAQAMWNVCHKRNGSNYPTGCRMDAALRNNGQRCLYAAGGFASQVRGPQSAYLVCRNGVTNEQAGKITPNPLRLRFWVTYQAGESEPMMLDVLTFQGNKDYQVFFRIGKDQSDCIFTTNESEALAGEGRSLLESRANDK